MRGTVVLILAIILLLTQLPSILCVFLHAPSGTLDNPSTSETANKIDALLKCVAPTSVFSIVLFVVGGIVAARI